MAVDWRVGAGGGMYWIFGLDIHPATSRGATGLVGGHGGIADCMLVAICLSLLQPTAVRRQNSEDGGIAILLHCAA